MKVAYINQSAPVKKISRSEELQMSALLLASQLRGRGKRNAARILEIELNEKAGACTPGF